MDVRLMIAVVAGGAVGALTRGAALELATDQRSVALLAINAAGSFLLGLAVVRLAENPSASAAVGTGFCGALTSMSAFAVDVANRLHEGQWGSATALVVMTVGLALTGALAGLHMGAPE